MKANAKDKVMTHGSRETIMREADKVRLEDRPNTLQHELTVPSNTLSPVLVIMFILMLVFPFVVRTLPSGLKQYLDLLFR